MREVLLGVFDGYMPLERNKLTSETKIGGSPTYRPSLSESQLMTIREWTTCGVCGRHMFLVLQAFSPLPQSSAGHHRMIYVFCCNSDACSRQPSSSWCAFTLQAENMDEEALDDIQSEEAARSDPVMASELPPSTFPPCYVAIDSEPRKEIVVPTDLEAEMIRAAQENAKNPDITENDIKELEQTIDLKDKPADYEFDKFRRRVAREPSQVIRYYERFPTESCGVTLVSAVAPPLFMRPSRVKEIIRIPPCRDCGAALIHELQIMPTSVYYLRVRDYIASGSPSGDEGVDWGTVTVFVCSKDCSKDRSGSSLRKEFVFVEKAPEQQDELENLEGRVDLRTFMTGRT
ncbi:hypothetical protein, conserved [Trypanosoma brucei brucei TREU927]|uniref:Programmed cell death protein 2 C-terminal domain-containing protein n=1 Tax=Trypanosoma brucei brucei (strain 927/4 GUTat10.1) TaxID=185431 RepID=Q38CC0_TRYB2|nr:hypothetical protein, conserved [Trypanosoma brucei brucei TREU927]EAN77550.1 hypothetical protein, conserved [Trypanosoma brucei brucei TREU927]